MIQIRNWLIVIFVCFSLVIVGHYFHPIHSNLDLIQAVLSIQDMISIHLITLYANREIGSLSNIYFVEMKLKYMMALQLVNIPMPRPLCEITGCINIWAAVVILRK